MFYIHFHTSTIEGVEHVELSCILQWLRILQRDWQSAGVPQKLWVLGDTPKTGLVLAGFRSLQWCHLSLH